MGDVIKFPLQFRENADGTLFDGIDTWRVMPGEELHNEQILEKITNNTQLGRVQGEE